MQFSGHAIFLALALIALGCDGTRDSPSAAASADSTATPSATAAPAVDADQHDTCKQCHGNIVTEWNESMHARAHHSRDPIYAGVRRLRAKREGEQVTRACASCHTPRDVDNDASAVAKAGVTCGACHATAEIRPDASGARALIPTEGSLLLGPHDVAPDKTPAHATGAAPAHMLGTDRLCNACHQELKGPTGIPICSTGVEHAAVSRDAKRCVDCHMPVVEGPSGSAVARTSHRSHRFLGPHRAWYNNDDSLLKRAVDLHAALAPGKLTVTLTNKSQHAVPTGFPGRMAMLVVEGMKAGSSDIVFRSDGSTDGATLRKVYVDDKGKPTLAPWAKALKSDRRLGVGEQRVVVFAVPKDVARVRVKFVFRLLPPPLAKKLGLADAVEAKPKVIIERLVMLQDPSSAD
jgi:hypothetical protein